MGIGSIGSKGTVSKKCLSKAIITVPLHLTISASFKDQQNKDGNTLKMMKRTPGLLTGSQVCACLLNPTAVLGSLSTPLTACVQFR